MGATTTAARVGNAETSQTKEIQEVFKEVCTIAVNVRHVDWLRRYLLTAKRALVSGDKAMLNAGATASSDYGATLAVLQPAALAEIAENDDPLAAEHARGIQMMKELLEARGGSIRASKLAALREVTVQAIHQQRKRGQLIAMDAGRKEILIPVWQFGPNWKVVKGLPVVLAELKKNGTDSWDLFTFFLNPTFALSGKAPIDELKNGHIDAVLRAARLYDEHGAL